MRQVKTERLTIRPIQVTDYEELQSILFDPEVVRYTRYRDITNTEKFAEIFEQHFLNNIYTFGIETKIDHKLIGFYEFHPEENVGILTYALAQDAWGKGYVAEVGIAMMNYGFEELNFDKIEAHYASLNPRSGKVMHKMGMKDLGQIDTFTVPESGEEHQVMAYELTKDDWKLNQAV
ncbi:GNAT family N-acetyltransferase [Companilactobacillus musae]|uniref:GNAT family N-acetyltransferase n=1 Tax=Companilactobacillus musae TaxID=1903258 RepID=UPI000E64DBFB|nr:GNAT family N-acetyltransferase [Companilactobacillus musae]